MMRKKMRERRDEKEDERKKQKQTMGMVSQMKVILNVKTLILLQQGTMGVRKTQRTPLII